MNSYQTLVTGKMGDMAEMYNRVKGIIDVFSDLQSILATTSLSISIFDGLDNVLCQMCPCTNGDYNNADCASALALVDGYIYPNDFGVIATFAQSYMAQYCC